MDGGRVLRALGEQPGGPELLRAGAAHEPALVGGAVRDLLLGRAPRELDVVVAGDTVPFATALAADIGREMAEPPSARFHERFGTAIVEWPGGRVDVAQRRAESYPGPGALPEVRPGSVAEDLDRRDFTVNAIALPLSGPRPGELVHAEHALEDLEAGQLRVLHERSFLDDPTRLLRLARYRARLGFAVEPATAELARAALQQGALATVSGARLGTELRLTLREDDAVAALHTADELGVLAAIDPGLRLDDGRARRAGELLPADARPDLLLMACLLLDLAGASGGGGEPAILALLDRLEFPAEERRRIARGALAAPALSDAMAAAGSPSALHKLLRGEPSEAIAIAGSDGRSPELGRVADQWFERLRHVRLQISGRDLLDAGIAPGPELGSRLAAALAGRLDGEIPDGRDAELAAALAPLEATR